METNVNKLKKYLNNWNGKSKLNQKYIDLFHTITWNTENKSEMAVHAIFEVAMKESLKNFEKIQEHQNQIMNLPPEYVRQLQSRLNADQFNEFTANLKKFRNNQIIANNIVGNLQQLIADKNKLSNENINSILKKKDKYFEKIKKGNYGKRQGRRKDEFEKFEEWARIKNILKNTGYETPYQVGMARRKLENLIRNVPSVLKSPEHKRKQEEYDKKSNELNKLIRQLGSARGPALKPGTLGALVATVFR